MSEKNYSNLVAKDSDGHWGLIRTGRRGRGWGDLGTLTVPSARAEITFPRADSDLLIFLASSSTAPSAPVLLTCQRLQDKYGREAVTGAKSKKREGPENRIKKAEHGQDGNPASTALDSPAEVPPSPTYSLPFI